MTSKNPSSVLSDLPADWPDRLLGMLERQRDLCHELRSCSQAQPQLINDDESAKLLELLNRRQSIIDELSRLASAIEPYRRAWPDLLGRLDANLRERLNAAVEEAQSVVDEVMQRDRADRERLQDRRNRLQAELESIDHGRRTNRAYTSANEMSSAPRFSRYMDEEG
ncbi:MAG: hypothetical protein ACF8PN_13845 [Phycisphaerales bacterium]